MPKKTSLTLHKIQLVTPSMKEFIFSLDQDVAFKTGQWMMLEIPAKGEIFKRAMSIASPDYEKDMNFCVKLVPNGKGGSIAMHNLQEGQTIQATGPFGLFTLHYPTSNDIVLIATGSGISPFKAMILDLLERHKTTNQIYLLFGNRTEDEIAYRDLFENLSKKHSNFHFLPTLSRADEQWNGERGYVQELIKKHISNDNKKRDFYICGMKEMVISTITLLTEKGFDKQRIFFERYN